MIADGRIALSGVGRGGLVGGGLVDWGLNDISRFAKDYRVLVGDFNGDGRSDALINKKKTERYQVFLSTGSGLSAQPAFTLPSGTTRETLGDVNGDGLTDLIYSSSQQIGVFFSNGLLLGSAGGSGTSSAGFLRQSDPAEVRQYTASGIDSFGLTEYKMGDFNGDGRVDIVGNAGISRSVGTGFESQPTALPERRQVTIVADYNGDGADDLGRADSGIKLVGDPRRKDNYIWLSTSGQADLMTSFQEPMGGRVSVTYGPSAGTPGSRLPFIMQVVKTMTLDDGRGTPTSQSTLSFAYEGGAWSRAERQFLGFRTVKVNLPCIAGESTCPQQVFTHDQSLGCSGEVLQDQMFDAPNGSLLSQKTTVLAPDAQLPFTCLAAATEDRVYAGAGSRAVRTDAIYDLYGNATQLIDYGVVEGWGDETVTVSTFAPNTSDYLVSCPMQTLVYQGTSASGALLSGTRISYDGGGVGQAPLRC
jgi:hypothetical protein